MDTNKLTTSLNVLINVICVDCRTTISLDIAGVINGRPHYSCSPALLVSLRCTTISLQACFPAIQLHICTKCQTNKLGFHCLYHLKFIISFGSCTLLYLNCYIQYIYSHAPRHSLKKVKLSSLTSYRLS